VLISNQRRRDVLVSRRNPRPMLLLMLKLVVVPVEMLEAEQGSILKLAVVLVEEWEVDSVEE